VTSAVRVRPQWPHTPSHAVQLPFRPFAPMADGVTIGTGRARRRGAVRACVRGAARCEGGVYGAACAHASKVDAVLALAHMHLLALLRPRGLGF
jgi:hypothetical protein